MELVYEKKYFNHVKNICFEVVKNDGARLEQKSVIKHFIAEKYKPCEIFRMSDVYGKACFIKNGFATISLR